VSDSIWKKEISFSRKKAQVQTFTPQDAGDDAAAAPAEPAPEQQPKASVWKKEISLGRKAKEAAPPSADVSESPPQPKQSLLKKEISFGRKAKEAAPPPADVSESPPQPKQSLLKKEISFGRKAKEEAPAASGPPAALEPKQSMWKKEISFSRKKHDKELERIAQDAARAFSPSFVPPAPPSDVPPTAVAEAAVAAMPDVDEPAAPAQAVEPAPLAAVPPVEPAAADEPPPFVPAPLQVAPEPPELASGPAPVEPASPSIPFAPVSLEQVPGVPLVPAEPAPVESAPVVPVPELPLDAVAPVEPEQPPASSPPALSTLSAAVLAASSDAPEATAPPAADVVAFPEQPPVTETPAQPEPVPLAPVPPPIQLAPQPVDLPPLAAAPDPVDPWLASAELPPAPAGPLPTAVHPPVPAAELAPVVEPHVPFWKKDVSFSRRRKESLEPELAGPVAAGGPWWKKELTLSRKPKPAAAEATADAGAVEPAAKTPWWKKEIGGRKTGAVATAAEAGDALTEVDVPPKAPFWKRGLSVGTPKLLKGSAKAGGKKGSKGAKRLVGLKIGGSQIAAARVSNNGVAELEQVARQSLPMGIVVGGELRDPDALADALKAFFTKNKLPKKGVRLGIANNRIGVRIFDIVGVDEDKQLANAIHFRAQEALPIPLDEAVLDYHVVDESVDAEGRNVRRVLLVVAYKELIDRYVGACRKAGITLAGIDLEAFALLRSLSPPTDGGSAALVAVAIGYDRSTFAVSDGRVCEFTRVLDWGGWSLNIALARAFDTAPSEVEALKCALSLDGSVAPDDVSAEQTALAVETIRRQVQSFARELVSSLQFYQNQPGSLGIGEIVITGGTAQLPGLAEELEKLIGVRVRVGNPLARLKVAKRVSTPAQQIGSLAVAIGLGIED